MALQVDGSAILKVIDNRLAHYQSQPVSLNNDEIDRVDSASLLHALYSVILLFYSNGKQGEDGSMTHLQDESENDQVWHSNIELPNGLCITGMYFKKDWSQMTPFINSIVIELTHTAKLAQDENASVDFELHLQAAQYQSFFSNDKNGYYFTSSSTFESPNLKAVNIQDTSSVYRRNFGVWKTILNLTNAQRDLELFTPLNDYNKPSFIYSTTNVEDQDDYQEIMYSMMDYYQMDETNALPVVRLETLDELGEKMDQFIQSVLDVFTTYYASNDQKSLMFYLV